jgi:branched-subunit amino acid aminotransferase/4-amino-4-deoxychorismate lyase
MVSLFESIRIEEYGNAVLVYNSERHAKRLFNSIKALSFQNPTKNTGRNILEHILFFQNRISNYLQYQFKKTVSYKENIIADPFKEAPTHRVYKLRFVFSEQGRINLNHEEYTRDLKQNWKVRIVPYDEFHINTEDLAWGHKLYDRRNIPVSKDWQEQIWLNEKTEICEGSFTNVFWQDANKNWYTPSITCNILPGIMREMLISTLKAQEVNYTSYDLKNATDIYLCNAMIGMKKINLDLQS